MTLQTLLSLDPIFWVLILLSLTALTISFAIFIQWLKLNPVFSTKADQNTTQYIQQIQAGEQRTPNNLRTALITAYWHSASLQKLTAAALENEVWRLAKLAINPLSNRLKALEVIATIAPLIGLLGTVLGMVEAFQAMELAGEQVNPAILSGGIWKALSTTAAGLIIAIPTFVAHSYFESKTQHAAQSMQNDLELFLTTANAK